MKGTQKGLLEGISVLDLADEQGSFCSKLLADLGAMVVKIEDPDSVCSRTDPSFRYNNAKKLGIALDLHTHKGKQTFRKLIQRADALVESFPLGHLETLALDYQQLRPINPGLIHLSITGFGQKGPKRAYRSYDTVQAAFGGQMFASRTSEGEPVKLFGTQSSYVASLFGAIALLLNLRRRRITGQGCQIDLSIQESVASTLGHVMIDYFHEGSIAGRQSIDDGPPDSFSILRCKDGYIQIPIFRNLETIYELMMVEAEAETPLEEKWQNVECLKKHRNQIIEAVEGWTGKHSKHKLFKLGQTMGFPWAPVESPKEVLKSSQLKARHFFINTASRNRRCGISLPNLPYKFSSFSPPLPTPAPPLGEHARRVLRWIDANPEIKRLFRYNQRNSNRSKESSLILSGIRVLDFTRMLSGPYATRILGDFGAEVIKVQSKRTASGAEQNDTPYFGAWNRNKRSISINLDCAEARELLLDLVAKCDVVVENFSPRVMVNWGLSYSRLKTIKPDLIMASISAMGQTGPWKDFVGFASTFHALSGLTCATSKRLDRPVDIGYAYGDVIAGLYAALAILSSIENRVRTGKGQYIDISAYEAVCTLLGPAFAEASQNREFSSCRDAAPFGCYGCNGKDEWCVIAIFNDAEWMGFCRISNTPDLISYRFSTHARRRKNRAELDRLIAQWTARFSAKTIVRRLKKAGIAAGIVQSANDLAKDPQLAARNFFLSLEHPKLGTQFSDRSALWPHSEKPNQWRAAPELGEGNHYVFQNLLGHSEEEYQLWIKKGILETK